MKVPEVAAEATEEEAPHPIELDLPVEWVELGQAAFEVRYSMCHPMDGRPGVTACARPGFAAGMPIEPFAGPPIFVGEVDAFLRHMCTYLSGLDDPTIALVVSYMCNAWGHEVHAVDATMVKVGREGGTLGLAAATPTVLKPQED